MNKIKNNDLKNLISTNDYEKYFIYKHLYKEIDILKEKNISNEEIINHINNYLQ